MIYFRCPTCQTNLQHLYAGEKVSCPQCGQRILVPAPLPSLPAANNPTVLGENPPPPYLSQEPGSDPRSTADNQQTEPVQEDARADDSISSQPSTKARPTRKPNEKFCHECGTAIRSRAEICPNCGVRQHGREVPPRPFDGEPHRGTIILVLGIVSFFVPPIPLGILAWIWANQDLQKMNAGLMDPEGRSATEAGKACGIGSTILYTAALGIPMLLLLVYFLMMFCFCGALLPFRALPMTNPDIAP
jgi:DNA-directed RNA polymerase subunit RPC12/RpoP